MHTSLTDIAGSDGSIFELLPDMFLLFDENGTICDLRHPQPELMSGKPEDYVGRPVSAELLRQMIGDESGKLLEALRTGRAQKLEYGRRDEKGRTHRCEAHLIRLGTGHLLADMRTVRRESDPSESARLAPFFRAGTRPYRHPRIGQKHGDRGAAFSGAKRRT